MSIKINVLGRVTGDVEVSETPNGKTIGKFGVASNTGKGDKETTTYVNFTVFGDAIDRVSKALKKGSVISVDGRDYQSYIKKSGDGIGHSAIFTDFSFVPFNSAPGNAPQTTNGAKPKASGFAGGGAKKTSVKSSTKPAPKTQDEALDWDSNDSSGDDGEEDSPF